VRVRLTTRRERKGGIEVEERGRVVGEGGTKGWRESGKGGGGIKMDRVLECEAWKGNL
jgi:hypothetical protein